MQAFRRGSDRVAGDCAPAVIVWNRPGDPRRPDATDSGHAVGLGGRCQHRRRDDVGLVRFDAVALTVRGMHGEPVRNAVGQAADSAGGSAGHHASHGARTDLRDGIAADCAAAVEGRRPAQLGDRVAFVGGEAGGLPGRRRRRKCTRAVGGAHASWTVIPHLAVAEERPRRTGLEGDVVVATRDVEEIQRVGVETARRIGAGIGRTAQGIDGGDDWRGGAGAALDVPATVECDCHARPRVRNRRNVGLDSV